MGRPPWGADISPAQVRQPSPPFIFFPPLLLLSPSSSPSLHLLLYLLLGSAEADAVYLLSLMRFNLYFKGGEKMGGFAVLPHSL